MHTTILLFLNIGSIIFYTYCVFTFLEELFLHEKKDRWKKLVLGFVNALFCLTAEVFFAIGTEVFFLLVMLYMFVEIKIYFHETSTKILFFEATIFIHFLSLYLIVAMTMAMTMKMAMIKGKYTGYLTNNINNKMALSALTMFILALMNQIFRYLMPKDKLQEMLKNKKQVRFMAAWIAGCNLFLLFNIYEINNMQLEWPVYLLNVGVIFLLLFGLYLMLFYCFDVNSLIHFKDLNVELSQELMENKVNMKNVINRENILQKKLYYDELTGLCSRYICFKKLRQLLLQKKEFVLCFIDVDQLKKVNDNLGHVKGDEYLCTVAKKVKEEIRDEDTACRFGGDEMVVFFECASTDMLEKKMEELNKNLKDISKDYPMSISFGMIMVDKGNTLSAAKLLEKADRKMYENKKQRKMNRE